MLEIWLVMALGALAVMAGLGHAWVLSAILAVAALGVAVVSGVEMRRWGLDGVFPFSHHRRRQGS